MGADSSPLLADGFRADQALDWGLINAAGPEAQLDAEVRRWADELLALSPTVPQAREEVL